MELDAFLAKIVQRPRPNNPMACVRTLAKELAEGAAENVWRVDISHDRGQIADKAVREYLTLRWENNYPRVALLLANNYLIDTQFSFRISDSAFQLIEDIEPSTIFISYRRKDSSAFALLVLLRLKSEGLEPFLDMSLEPGEDWHAGLKERIQQRDNFILILGKDTLSSKVVQKEIEWAIEHSATIIPIWHNDFEYRTNEWGLSDRVDTLLRNTHTIKVLEESASGYYKALV